MLKSGILLVDLSTLQQFLRVSIDTGSHQILASPVWAQEIQATIYKLHPLQCNAFLFLFVLMAVKLVSLKLALCHTILILPWVIIYNAIPVSWWQSYHARLILEVISKLQFWEIYLMYLNRQTLSPNTNLEGFLSPPMQVIQLGRLVYAFHGLRKIAYGYFMPQ